MSNAKEHNIGVQHLRICASTYRALIRTFATTYLSIHLVVAHWSSGQSLGISSKKMWLRILRTLIHSTPVHSALWLGTWP